MKDEILRWLSDHIDQEDINKKSGDFFAPRNALCRKAAFKETLDFVEELRDEDESTIDEILRGLIKDSDLEEVVCCLDMIAKETGYKVEMYSNDGVGEYPA